MMLCEEAVSSGEMGEAAKRRRVPYTLCLPAFSLACDPTTINLQSISRLLRSSELEQDQNNHTTFPSAHLEEEGKRKESAYFAGASSPPSTGEKLDGESQSQPFTFNSNTISLLFLPLIPNLFKIKSRSIPPCSICTVFFYIGSCRGRVKKQQ